MHRYTFAVPEYGFQRQHSERWGPENGRPCLKIPCSHMQAARVSCSTSGRNLEHVLSEICLSDVVAVGNLWSFPNCEALQFSCLPPSGSRGNAENFLVGRSLACTCAAIESVRGRNLPGSAPTHPMFTLQQARCPCSTLVRALSVAPAHFVTFALPRLRFSEACCGCPLHTQAGSSKLPVYPEAHLAFTSNSSTRRSVSVTS